MHNLNLPKPKGANAAVGAKMKKAANKKATAKKKAIVKKKGHWCPKETGALLRIGEKYVNNDKKVDKKWAKVVE